MTMSVITLQLLLSIILDTVFPAIFSIPRQHMLFKTCLGSDGRQSFLLWENYCEIKNVGNILGMDWSHWLPDSVGDPVIIVFAVFFICWLINLLILFIYLFGQLATHYSHLERRDPDRWIDPIPLASGQVCWGHFLEWCRRAKPSVSPLGKWSLVV